MPSHQNTEMLTIITICHAFARALMTSQVDSVNWLLAGGRCVVGFTYCRCAIGLCCANNAHQAKKRKRSPDPA